MKMNVDVELTVPAYAHVTNRLLATTYCAQRTQSIRRIDISDQFRHFLSPQNWPSQYNYS